MVSPQKKERVRQLTQELQHSQVIGLVDMQNLPAPQLQRMRITLAKQGVRITMSRKKLLQRSLEDSGREKIQELAGRIKGMPALLLTDSNPFTLYATIQKNKSEAPAKAGQISPRDIQVKAGPTNFAPGPIISELAAVGIKTKVEGGKLSIIQDTTIVREGQEISSKVAETLKRLDIKPMEIGLNVVAVWEKGLVFDARQLHIDEGEYAHNLMQAVQWAMKVALEMAYPTAETTELLLQQAFQEAKTVSLELNLITDLTAGDILAKVEREALMIIQKGKLEVPEKPLRKEGAAAVNPAKIHHEEKASAEAGTEEKSAKTGTEGKKEPHKEPPDLHSVKPHPKQGRVTQEEAAQLLDTLQKKGTLR